MFVMFYGGARCCSACVGDATNVLYLRFLATNTEERGTLYDYLIARLIVVLIISLGGAGIDVLVGDPAMMIGFTSKLLSLLRYDRRMRNDLEFTLFILFCSILIQFFHH